MYGDSKIKHDIDFRIIENIHVKAITQEGKIINFYPISTTFELYEWTKFESFEIGEGIELARCNGYNLKNLILPPTIKTIFCHNNNLTQLELPNGIERVICHFNNITELNIPSSVEELYCDKSVKGLDNIDWDCDIYLF